MTTTTVLAAFDDVNFIEGATRMNQEHWQEYFGTILPNGVYSGFESQEDGNSGERNITDGAVVADGLMAYVKTTTGYTHVGSIASTGLRDQFLCVRVYLKEQRAELVRKTGIVQYANGETLSNINIALEYVFIEFERDEGYQCERNGVYYEIPLYYQSEVGCFSDGRDLRRMVHVDRKPELNPNRTGIGNDPQDMAITWRDRFYHLSSYVSDSDYDIAMDTIDPVEGATVYIDPNGATTTIKLHRTPFTNNDLNGTGIDRADQPYRINFVLSNNWTLNDQFDPYYEYPVTDPITLRFTTINVDTTVSGYYNPLILVEEL